MKTLTLTLAALCLLAFAAEAQAGGYHANVQRVVVKQQVRRARVVRPVFRPRVVRQRIVQPVYAAPVVQTYYAPQPLILEQSSCYSAPVVQEYVAPLRQEIVIEKQVGGCREFFRSH